MYIPTAFRTVNYFPSNWNEGGKILWNFHHEKWITNNKNRIESIAFSRRLTDSYMQIKNVPPNALRRSDCADKCVQPQEKKKFKRLNGPQNR